MSHRSADDLVRECLEADLASREAAVRAQSLLGSFHAIVKDDIARSIADYNANGRGRFVYDAQEIKASVAVIDGSPVMCVTVQLGSFSVRGEGRTLMPREAWELDERALVGDLKNHLANHLLWVARCRLEVYPPLDYDMMSADPEL